MDDGWFEKADHYIAENLVERGYRPGETERLVLPTDLVERFRTGGLGWQVGVENVLKEWMAEHPERI